MKKKSPFMLAMALGFFSLSVFFMTACTTTPPRPKAPALFDGILFGSGRVPSGKVTLVNGEYREKDAAGNEITVYLDDHTATGEINQQPAAAAVLVTNTGEGEIYYDLALLKKNTNVWRNTDIAELGDRIKMKALSIEDDKVIAQFVGHGPYDRPCCASLDMVYQYTVSENRLVQVPDYSTCSAPTDLKSSLWKWKGTYYQNGAYSESYDPNLFTFNLIKECGINVRADCNTVGGHYSVDQETIAIQITPSAMAPCPEGSFSDQFLSDLKDAARYYFKNGNLYIVLNKERGVMKFSW